MRNFAHLAIAAVVVLLAPCACMLHAQGPADVDPLAALERALVDTIAQNEKSVVAIARVRIPRSDEALRPEFRPDPFGRRAVVSSGPKPTDPDFIPNEYGTGVVIDRRGLILTAYHVLGEDSEYYVTTADRKVYRARIKGADPRSDLAVLQIDAGSLKPITFGNAERVRKGEIVIALGNPHAIARDGQVSASWGMISNLHRKAPPTPSEFDSTGKRTLHHFGTLIQTDAKLNLGTSGGPLLNRRGEMVGLTVALAATAGYEKAAGYAIPVDATFRRVVDVLKEGREVEYGFLGIQPANLQPQEVLAGLHGIRVFRVEPGTPADRYGLKPDDLITAVAGRPIYEADGLMLEVGRLPVESIARLGVVRDGKRRTVNVTLTKYRVREQPIVTNRPRPWRGMRVDYPSVVVSADPRARSRQPYYDEGVIVTTVAAGSPAAAAELQPGMRITHVGRTLVRTPKEFFSAVGSKSGSVQVRLADVDETVRTITSGT